MKIDFRVESSFRDPDGFLYWQDGVLYRQINKSYKNDYELLMGSGLYKRLADEKLLVSHEEAGHEDTAGMIYRIIRPEVVPFISYPYEWCFSQLKSAALAALNIQKISLGYGMSLKDASAYNIQFKHNRPIFIDTLSFEKYNEGLPWAAYRQFCQHFLAPLALMSCRDIRLGQLLRIYIDGIPLSLASKILPLSTYFKFGLLTHVHLHARSQAGFQDKVIDKNKLKIKKSSLLGIIDSLESAIKKLKYPSGNSVWTGYYEDKSYSEAAFSHKKQLVKEYLSIANPRILWDLGSNTGAFSKISAGMKAFTISCDDDPCVVEKNYLSCLKENEVNVHPLLIDLANPSPGIGWENMERMSFKARGPADAAMALALVHHLAISNNIPFSKIAEFFSSISRWLVIEFVPKSDLKVKKLLAAREDIFHSYTKEYFQEAFNKYFIIRKTDVILDTDRCLYLMEKK